MFLGKVQGENQQKLLHFLSYLHGMNWGCLTIGTIIQPSIGEIFNRVRKRACAYILSLPTQSELIRDFEIFSTVFYLNQSSDKLPLTLELLSASTLDLDEFLGYFATVRALSNTGLKTFDKHVTAKGNKEKYKSLRKCKNLLKPFATVSTSLRLLSMATFYYQTGNYMNTLEICTHIISSSKLYLGNMSSCKYRDRYKQLYCGRGYNLLKKCQAFVSDIMFRGEAQQFCPSQLHPEISKLAQRDSIRIPPLPYAVFLSFLCYHELGDTRRRDKSLIDLRYLKYDEEQGCSKHWIVHNLLGICYEMVEDTRSALREYTESLKSQGPDQHQNAAKERIERLQHSHI
ncbi:hypothetical protein KP79_PYT23255 [Mizuhopecten yessoensis]|uniref:Uncharacterized protein n=2 Tax=Mizuhopecten yessoensis TaxID=6573 RepID=A0A210Q5Z1_MIZYE|nr:hypothetical protein KP79_PYT23255 [Mizuhopecten yessoensis]